MAKGFHYPRSRYSNRWMQLPKMPARASKIGFAILSVFVLILLVLAAFATEETSTIIRTTTVVTTTTTPAAAAPE